MRLKGGEQTCDLGAVRIILFLWGKVKITTLILPFPLHSIRARILGICEALCVLSNCQKMVGF